MIDRINPIDELYSQLSIQNQGKKIRNTINTGNMEKKMKTNYSLGVGNASQNSFSSGIQAKE